MAYVISLFSFINTYMANKTIKFVKTNSDKLSEVQNNDEYKYSIIHVHDEGDSEADDTLYIGKDRVTDKLNVGDRNVDTHTNAVGGLEASTIGGLRKKTVSEILLDIVTGSDPLDSRLVVDSLEDLTNGTINNPYQGMVVNVKGDSKLWVLTGDNPADVDSWSEVSGVDEELVARLEQVEETVGSPEDGDTPATGIFEELDNLNKKVKGAALGHYTIPIMTPEMVAAADSDDDIDFDSSETPHILAEYPPKVTESERDYYLDQMSMMWKTIQSLQAEVTRLRNTFEYGIDSYTNRKTFLSTELSRMDDVEAVEPLWALDPGLGLIMVQDSLIFNTLLDESNTFIAYGDCEKDLSVNDVITFRNGYARFYDGGSETASDENLTLYKINDSKLVTYLVTDQPTIKMGLISLDDKEYTREIDFSSLLGDNVVDKYGYCVVISRQVKNQNIRTGEETLTGFNYIYFSIINYNTSDVLAEGYLTNEGILTDIKIDCGHRYAIKYLEFDRLTLSRMKFYTKYEDFTEEVIPVAPGEFDDRYEVAHITIRSVRDKAMLDDVANELRDNELIWNKDTNTLHIKSNGKIYAIGSQSEEDKQKDDNMTDREIIEALNKMGIVVNVEYKIDEHGDETDEILSVSNMSLAPISDITFINEDTSKKFTFSVDPEGNLVGKDKSAKTIKEELGSAISNYENPSATYKAVRGFSADYLMRKSGSTDLNKTSDAGKQSDRLRISAFYAPLSTDEKHGCTHSFIELENSSPVDIPLTGVYLHFFNPAENTYNKVDSKAVLTSDNVHHLELDGVIKAGSTYLIRGAKHAEFDDESAFIKVKTYDKEWYENGELISFEQLPGVDNEISDTSVPAAYRFCLTYGLSDLSATKKLIDFNTKNGTTIGTTTYDNTDYPNIILDPRFIDCCNFPSNSKIAQNGGTITNPWYANGGSNGNGIQIKSNTMFRLMFALDPAKQAFNGFNAKDSSRTRYNKATDIQILNLDKEFIGYPNSKETIKIDRYTPKASFENKNVMTDKSQLNREKPNMVTCSFGVDVYNTRCFNWISCGAFDESVWIRVKNDENPNPWKKFDSYKKVSSATAEETTKPYRKEYSVDVNNVAYARMINRFPGNDVLFTAHKCVIVLPDASEPTVYEYVVGRADKDGKPDFEHTNSIYTFTLYPRSYEGRVYQVTDQQGFHWIEYQVWAASAEYLNTKISSECAAINADTNKTNVFPILMNTGDMTQSGARINEWLDYYNGGVCLFDHLEQMNCVGNNDLCPIDPRQLGTGNDSDKSSSHFFHYFYCFDVKDTEKYDSVSADDKKFFSGETFVVKAHTGTAKNLKNPDKTDIINVKEDKYIPSFYYFKTGKVLYIVVNSEIPISNCQDWFGLCSNSSTPQYVNIYTGIEAIKDGTYAGDVGYFTPLYETMYAWLKSNQDDVNSRKVVVAMHEMPFTVITKVSLANNSESQIPCTRNHPTKAGRLGSNVNQLNINENKGIYWCSRLLEWFNCKLVIGGHKHTYALTYPIKEKYSWTYNGVTKDSSVERKPMFATLADEANGGDYNVSWEIDLTSDTVRNEYKITTTRTGTPENPGVPDSVKLNSTKTPYIPENLYNEYGSETYTHATGLFRCCTPLTVNTSNSSGDDYNPTYNNFVTYSMCQATGYKLKSNKELPSIYQMFSKIIPETSHGTSSDSPSSEQLYPMYSVLEFNNDCSELNISMNRITGIFNDDGGDKFDQNAYGKGVLGVQTLSPGPGIYGTWENAIDTSNRYLHIIF